MAAPGTNASPFAPSSHKAASVGSTSKPPSTVAIQPQRASMLLRLPKECRDIIYGHLLTTDALIAWPGGEQPLLLTPSILRTCRQVHREASPILYKSNAFLFVHPSDCTVFRHVMDQSRSKSIARVTFRIRARYFDKIWRSYLTNRWQSRSLSQDLPNLKSLTFVLEGSSWQARRHPEENLQEWFNREAAFVALCQALAVHQDEPDPHKIVAEVSIVCRQRIPQPHFDQLRRLAGPPLDSGANTRTPLVLVSETCLCLPSGGRVPEHVSLQLLSPSNVG